VEATPFYSEGFLVFLVFEEFPELMAVERASA
jgi:hypothetical protein